MQLDCPHCGQRLEYSGKRPAFCAYCGKPLDRPPLSSTGVYAAEAATLPPEPGGGVAGPEPDAVGGYRLVRPLGAGGMGTVYEAEEVATGRRVALKLIAAEYAASPDAVERFRREGRLASAVAHPRCVFVLAADEEAGRPYIVMELMPGSTLKDLAERQGPLPPGEAVAKILDVIDGLREAHRLGVVHRDVKPSNCFLDADGRVKVGDFGLSKSLIKDAHLTKTGAFVGTPLFASPEQVRGDTVDAQSDLYSVAATLYFLLTGRAPFESADAAVTLVRIAADPAPPMRTLRSELSQGLDEVVLRGLERERARRWRDLDEFRAALQPFLPGTQTTAGPGIRFGAILIDFLVLGALLAVATFALFAGSDRELFNPRASARESLAHTVLFAACWLLYWGVCESVWGCSLGKGLLGLRVRTATGSDRPRPRRIVVRTLVFYVLANLGGLLTVPLFWGTDALSHQEIFARAVLYDLLAPPALVVGVGLLLCTMRRRNGYGGLHEFASGTRVIRLPERERRRAVRTHRPERPLARPEGLPERVGPYAVRGALRWDSDGQILLAVDAALERPVLLWLRPQAEPPLPAARRDVTRPTRLRWLACGQVDGRQWDAFLAPAGPALSDLVAGGEGLPWVEVRPILEQLAEELTAAAADGTLPASLREDQVCVRPGGPVQLLDWPLADETRDPARTDPGGAPAQQSLALLGRVAVLGLEGPPGRANRRRGPRRPVRAPVPEHAAGPLARLLGFADPYRDVAEFEAELAASRDQPAEITRSRRASQLAVLAVLSALALGCCMWPAAWVPGFFAMDIMIIEEEFRQQTLEELEAGSVQECAAAAVNPDPLVRLRGCVQRDVDERLAEQLRERIRHSEDERRLRSRALGVVTRRMLRQSESNIRNQARMQWETTGARRSRKTSRREEAVGWRQKAAEMVAEGEVAPMVTRGLVAYLAVLLVAWPAAWVVWAFLWRGGLSFRWLGLALVRSDGRKAAGWQCALRALVVWAPVTALWFAAFRLEMPFWSTTPAGDPDAWPLWLASGLWWAGLLLLAAYVVLALVFPRRGLHDWLAGTYLVPR
jgi:hypothetical protein